MNVQYLYIFLLDRFCMASSGKVAILVVVIVIVAVVGYAAYAGYIPGLKFPSSTPTTSTAPNMSVVSSSDVNSSIGGSWNQVANLSFSTSNFTLLLNAAMNLSSQSSTTGGISSSSFSLGADQTVGQVQSVELVDFYSNSGMIAAGYAHFKTNSSAQGLYSLIQLGVTTNASLKNNVTTGTLSSYSYFILNGTSSSSVMKTYSELVVSNYGGEIIVIYQISSSSISTSNMLSLLSKEFFILKTYGPKTNGAPLIVSRSTVNSDLGLSLNNSFKIGAYVNSPFLLSKQVNFTSNLSSGSSTVGTLNLTTKTTLNASLSPEMFQSAIYFKGNTSLFGAAVVKFGNNTVASDLYTNVTKSIVAAEGSINLSLTTHLHWVNTSGYVYFNYSYVNVSSGLTETIYLAFGHAGGYIYALGYVGTIGVTNTQFTNLVKAQANLL
jgi:hypothetical protein